MVPIDKILSCFCKSRELQSSCTDLLNLEEITEEEKKIILDLILSFVRASNKLKSLGKSEK